ncbi:MAG: hypothetical protein AAB648_01840, partial [Patescibacteria group bacterium]
VCIKMFKSLKLNKFWLKRANIVVVILALTVSMPINEANAAWGYKDILRLVNNNPEIRQNLFLITGSDAFISINAPLEPKPIRVVLTAYSSTPDQTDDTPFITASNTRVRDGVVAANFLAFGTQLKIPSLFGDKVFTVEDRMARKHPDKIDIWFPERHFAKNFGVQEANVIILD